MGDERKMGKNFFIFFKIKKYKIFFKIEKEGGFLVCGVFFGKGVFKTIFGKKK